MLVDSHCHLNYKEFSDLDATLNTASEHGVGLVQTISTKRSDFAEVIALAEADERIFASIGIHPHEAEKHADITVEELLKQAQHPKVIGIGETGLDYYYEHSPRDIQQHSFRVHIDAARQSGLPLIVHSRDADEDTVNILREEMERAPFTGLLHCFSSGTFLAEQSLALGLYISFSGIITFRKAEALREVAAIVPMERLLVETDAPYLAPEPFRGKPNEPAYTRYTAEKLADIRGVSYEVIEQVTTENFFRLFTRAVCESGVS